MAPKTEIEKINEKLDKIDDDNQNILRYLYNDDKTQTKGLVQQVREVRKDLDALTNKVAVWSLVFTGIGMALISLGKFLISKLV